jgi:hypothetical protein
MAFSDFGPFDRQRALEIMMRQQQLNQQYGLGLGQQTLGNISNQMLGAPCQPQRAFAAPVEPVAQPPEPNKVLLLLGDDE